MSNLTVTGIDVSTLPNGTLTYSVWLTDDAGNVGPTVTATATLDRTAPTGYGITAGDSLINNAEASTSTFTITGAEVGDAYTCTISNGSSQKVVSGTIATATQTVSGVDVSGLPDGQLTYSLTLTDQVGNAGTAVTTTAALNKTAPAGYTITVDQDPIDDAAASHVSFTFAGATVGDHYQYTVKSSGGTDVVSGDGDIGSATQQITGIDVSHLLNGDLTYSVTLTDGAGNVGQATTATATLDKAVPTGYSITLGSTSINAASAATTSFTFAAQVNAAYHYKVTSTGGTAVKEGTGTIATATDQIGGIDVSGLADGTLTYTVTLANAVGDVGPTVTQTATLDKTLPAGYSITADQPAFNAANAAHASFTFAGAETTAGTTYTYEIRSSNGTLVMTGTGPITSANQQVTDIDISSLLDGTLTFSVSVKDAAGNVGPVVTTTALLDREAPAGYSITVDQSTITSSAGPSDELHLRRPLKNSPPTTTG